jgi:hypothetical protein
VVKGEEGLQALVSNYFINLFSPMAGTNMEHILDHIIPGITKQVYQMLSAEYRSGEVKAAPDSIGDLKALGPEGMPAIFYKKFWRTVGDTLVHEVLIMLRSGSLPEGWNETVVQVIPKVHNLEGMKDLRPVSLCNVVYKFISKVLANCLKVILDELISPN